MGIAVCVGVFARRYGLEELLDEGLAATMALPPPRGLLEELVQPLQVPRALEGQKEKLRLRVSGVFSKRVQEDHIVTFEGQGDAPQAPLLLHQCHEAKESTGRQRCKPRALS